MTNALIAAIAVVVWGLLITTWPRYTITIQREEPTVPSDQRRRAS